MKLVRFDWAIKKLLRHKANFTILEGFLSELLRFDVKIESILESEANKEDELDKYNKVDILVKADNGELMLVEVQNGAQLDYFQRMIYGASRLITEYIMQGEAYGTIKKVFSINIVYFDLGQGQDYVYEYKGYFEGLHQKDRLLPSTRQRKEFQVEAIADIFPKYYLLKINNFDDVAKNTLDEWVYFLKNSEIKEGFSAKGLKEASEKLQEAALSGAEKIAYQRYQENVRVEKSVLQTAVKEGEERGEKRGKEKGKVEERKQLIWTMHKQGLSTEQIANFTQLSTQEVEAILKQTN